MGEKLLKKRKGFTLVEVIVVLVILAILAAALIPSMIGYVKESKEKIAVSNIGLIKRSLVVASSGIDVRNLSEVYIPVNGYKSTIDDEMTFYNEVKKLLDPDFKGQYYVMIIAPKNHNIKNMNDFIEKHVVIYYGEKGYLTKPYYVYRNSEITRVE